MAKKAQEIILILLLIVVVVACIPTKHDIERLKEYDNHCKAVTGISNK